MLEELLKKHKTIKKNIHSLKNDHVKMVGEKITISEKYRTWLRSNLDSLTDNKGDELLEDIINKKRVNGVVINTKYDNQDGIILTVKFDDGKYFMFRRCFSE